MKCVFPVVTAPEGKKDTLCGKELEPGQSMYCSEHKGNYNPHVGRPHFISPDPNPHRSK